MALKYNGQQGAGIQALISLQCWAASFHLPVAVLEPIMSGTDFISIPQQNNSFMRFSDLFDIEHFNQRSQSLGFVPIGTREDFATNAPTEVIYIRIQQSFSRKQATTPLKINDSELDGKHHCYEEPQGTPKLSQLGRSDFCITRMIEVDYSYVTSTKHLQKFIYGNRSPQDITIIFKFWSTPWLFRNRASKEDPNMCKDVGVISNKEQFIPSPRLLSDSINYEEQFLKSQNEVALMLRIEHMIEYVDQHSKWTVNACLQEALKVTKGHLHSGLPMITLDMGKFGSDAWTFLAKERGVDADGLSKKSKAFLEKIYDGTLTFEEWEESFTKAARGVEHSGYIAALQRTLASRAKCLVLVGGGSFQTLALNDYFRIHPNKEDQCVHLVCTIDGDRFNRILARSTSQKYG